MRRIIIAILACFLALPVHATVNSSTNSTTILGTGSQTSFSFNFIGVSSAYISVLYTTSGGVQTLLTQGSGASQYTITLNTAVQGAIWGIGGTVTYNPGTPIPVGSTLTIFRTLPLTQAISLQNLASIAVLGKGAETGLDTGVMQGQQINGTISRAIVANIANSAPPLPLPPAAQMANQGVCGDGSGLNLVPCAIPSSGVISSAMQPVVNSASLAAGRTAFGLGSMAVENINGGSCGGSTLQDDGAGNARVVFTQVSDTTNQSVTCAFSQSQRAATGPITYTLPRANTLFSGWGFKVIVTSGQVTFTANASDNFSGVASGGSVTAAAGSVCNVTTNAASSGTWQLSCVNSPPSISANATANALTLTLNGSLINFRDPVLANGDPLWALLTSGVSITIPTGATLGTSNNVPFRVWLFAVYNSGTPILAVATCSSSAGIYGCTSLETRRFTASAISVGSTLPGVFYGSTSVTNDSIRIVGYAEYASGLPTAGSWSTAPTTLQICMPPFFCPRPGDVVQTVYATTFSNTNCASLSWTTTNVSGIIPPTSSVNLFRVRINGSLTNAADLGISAISIFRNSTLASVPLIATAAAANGNMAVGLETLDQPGTTSPITYSAKCQYNSGGGGTFPTTNGGSIIIDEIMG